MTVDYAKSSPPQPPQSSLWGWAIGIGVAVIATLAGLGYYHAHHHSRNNKPTLQVAKTKQHKAVTASASAPRYDFYQMLPHMEITTQNTTTSAIVPQHQLYYVLQVATSTDETAATALVTRLGVMGVNAFLKSDSTDDTHPRFRVMVGPYADKQSAAIDQHFLHANHQDSLLLKAHS